MLELSGFTGALSKPVALLVAGLLWEKTGLGTCIKPCTGELQVGLLLLRVKPPVTLFRAAGILLWPNPAAGST